MMSHTELNEAYWRQRYQAQNTPWDTGTITPPLQIYIDNIEDKDTRILIPGAGNAHEAIYLHQQGFNQVWVCDWAPEPLEALSQALPDFPKEHLLCIDFFEIDQKFDLLLEQTFFCAIDPSQRPQYVEKAAELLQDKGVLAGLLFSEPFPFPGPPFGGTAAEYQKLFQSSFDIKTLAISPHSLKPRAGRELFVEMISKK